MRKRAKSAISLGAVACLVAAGTVLHGVGPAEAQSGCGVVSPDGPVCGTPAPRLISGTLLSNGVAVANADVTLSPIETGAAAENLAEGASTPIVLAGATRTNSNGAFSINISPSALGSNFVQPNGTVNFELDAADSTREIIWDFGATPEVDATGKTTWAADGEQAASGTGAAPTLAADLGAKTAYDPQNDPAQAEDESGAVIGASARSTPVLSRDGAMNAEVAQANSDTTSYPQYSSPSSDNGSTPQTIHPDAGAPCARVWHAWHRNIKEHFETVYAFAGAKATVTEGVTSYHNLGVGFSTDSYAHMSANGSASLEFSQSHNATATNVVNSTVWNRVNYRDYTLICSVTRYYRQPMSKYDLLTNDWTYSGVKQYTHCGSHSANTTWSTGGEHNGSYGGGIDIGPISVSAQSGWGNSQDITYNFTQSGHVCGNNVNGPLQSSRVDSQA